MGDDDEKYGIGTAIKYPDDRSLDYFYGTGPEQYVDPSKDRSNEPLYDSTSPNQPYVRSSTDVAATRGNEGYGEGMTGAQTSAYDSILNATGSKELANALSKFFGSGSTGGGLGNLVGNIGGVLGTKAGMAGLLALLSYLDRQKTKPATGGGTTMGYTPPPASAASAGRVVQGPYGPIMQYAAQGGLMNAYNYGGKVQMEDGGFVMTKRAVDGAGGPRGIQSLVPGARMIRGPGTGTSDSIPAVIRGKGRETPAAVSNGEAYVPKDDVDRLGGAQRMYTMMRQLTKKARA